MEVSVTVSHVVMYIQYRQLLSLPGLERLSLLLEISDLDRMDVAIQVFSGTYCGYCCQ